MQGLYRSAGIYHEGHQEARRIFFDANALIAGADARSGASHTMLIMDENETKDAPILAAAVMGKGDRLITLNTKDFTEINKP